MRRKTTGIVMDALSLEHDTGPGHPERPARFAAVAAGLKKAGVIKKGRMIAGRDATDEEILAVHMPEYLALVKEEIGALADVEPSRWGFELSTGDVAVSARSLEVARRATGGVLAAVDAVFAGKFRNAFCANRPPGHHARAGQGMGFCLFNHVAVAARYAQRMHGVGKVLIVDWDVHHGNGTQDIFYEDPSVMFFSTHQYPWYPGTGAEDEKGAGKARGTTVNVPLPAGSGREEVLPAVTDVLGKKVRRFKPELILISAGFDSRAGDPLGKFLLEDADFAEITRVIKEMAEEFCDGRIVSVLEGGYALEGLASAAAAHVKALDD